MVSTNGWNWAATSFELPDSLKLELQAIPYAVASRGCDKLAWKDSEHGMFNLWSKYKIAMYKDRLFSFRGNWIWKAKILRRIQYFV